MTKRTSNTIQILDKTLKGGFAATPRVVLRCSGLSMQAKTLYSLLLDYAWQTGSCFPGQERLAIDLDVHKNTISKYLNELRVFGLIDWKQRGLNKTNIYYILQLGSVFTQKYTETQGVVIPEVQPSVTQESHESVNIIEEAKYKKNKYKQPLTLERKKINNPKSGLKTGNVNEDLNKFDKEAVMLAEELGDTRSIKYFQKLINKRNRGEISDEDIHGALNQTRKAVSESKGDGTNFLKNPSAWFVSILKKMTQKRDQKKRMDKLDELKQQFISNSKL